MKADRLRILIQEGEGPRLEFKQAAIKPSDLAETLVAFANAAGGIVALGVDDHGSVAGITDAKRVRDLVLTAGSGELCDPPIRLRDLSFVEVSPGERILTLEVPRSKVLHATGGRFLVRRGSQNVTLSTADVTQRTHGEKTGPVGPNDQTKGYPSVYDVLDFELGLKLLDAGGRSAEVIRVERLRFHQDGVMGIYHQIWGEGELQDYQVEPGVVADRFSVGPRTFILISLREVKNRGDELTLTTCRRVSLGWTQSEEWLEAALSHRTAKITLKVTFPKGRPPTSAELVELPAGNRARIERTRWTTDQSGCTTIRLTRKRPQVGSSYVLRWTW